MENQEVYHPCAERGKGQVLLQPVNDAAYCCSLIGLLVLHTPLLLFLCCCSLPLPFCRYLMSHRLRQVCIANLRGTCKATDSNKCPYRHIKHMPNTPPVATAVARPPATAWPGPAPTSFRTNPPASQPPLPGHPRCLTCLTLAGLLAPLHFGSLSHCLTVTLSVTLLSL